MHGQFCVGTTRRSETASAWILINVIRPTLENETTRAVDGIIQADDGGGVARGAGKRERDASPPPYPTYKSARNNGTAWRRGTICVYLC